MTPNTSFRVAIIGIASLLLLHCRGNSSADESSDAASQGSTETETSEGKEAPAQNTAFEPDTNSDLSETLESSSDTVDSSSDTVDSCSDTVDSCSDTVDSCSDTVDSCSDTVDSNSDTVDSCSDTVDSNSDTVDSCSSDPTTPSDEPSTYTPDTETSVDPETDTGNASDDTEKQDTSVPSDTDMPLLSVLERTRPRVIVMSDIGGTEPDDQQSFVRLLLYSNEMDIVGLIGANSQFGANRGDTEVFKSIIETYETVRPNLQVHATGYPTAETLLATIKTGQREKIGMEGVGDAKGTDGSAHILAQLKNSDSRPLWVLAWGGTNTLAQALYELQADTTLSSEDRVKLIRKLRILDIAGQDDSGAWMAHTFYPDLFYIRSTLQFLSFAKRGNMYTPGEEAQGDLSVANSDWFQANIQSNHGPLGKRYPNAVYMFEGDTPSFLYLTHQGPGHSEYPHFGSWGGRFTKEKVPAAGRYSGNEASAYLEDHGAPMFNDAEDAFYFAPDDTTYTTRYTPLWRWREAYQNDFAARMDWTVSETYSDANHPPNAVIGEIANSPIVQISSAAGESVVLHAGNSTDPDGNTLHFQWQHYPEPGGQQRVLELEPPTAQTSTFVVPKSATVGTRYHILLFVSDDGEPTLTSYGRVIVEVI